MVSPAVPRLLHDNLQGYELGVMGVVFQQQFPEIHARESSTTEMEL